MFSLGYFLLYSHWSPCFDLCSLCFAHMVYKTEIELLKTTVALKYIAENISCEDDRKMMATFPLDNFFVIHYIF